MKRFLRKNWSEVAVFAALCILYVDSCIGLAFEEILHPIARACAFLVILSYVLYYGEVTNRKNKRLRAERRKRLEEQAKAEIVDDYRQFRREYQERQNRKSLELWDW